MSTKVKPKMPTTVAPSQDDIEAAIKFKEKNEKVLKSLSFRGIEVSLKPVEYEEYFPNISKGYKFKGGTQEIELVMVVLSTDALPSMNCQIWGFALAVAISGIQICLLYFSLRGCEFKDYSELTPNFQTSLLYLLIPFISIVTATGVATNNSGPDGKGFQVWFHLKEPAYHLKLQLESVKVLIYLIFDLPCLLILLIFAIVQRNRLEAQLQFNNLLLQLKVYLFMYTTAIVVRSQSSNEDVLASFLGLMLVMTFDSIVANTLHYRFMAKKVVYKKESDKSKYAEMVTKYNTTGQRYIFCYSFIVMMCLMYFTTECVIC